MTEVQIEIPDPIERTRIAAQLTAARLDAAKAVLSHAESMRQPLGVSASQAFKGILQATYDEALAYIGEQLRGGK